MRFRRLLLTAVAALALAPAAAAHHGAPFWSKKQAEARVLAGPIELSGRLLRLSEVSCLGTGSLRVRVAGVLKFKHFNCLVAPARERRFWLKLHPLKKGWTYGFLNWA